MTSSLSFRVLPNSGRVELQDPDILFRIVLDDALYCQFVVMPNHLQTITKFGPESLDVFTCTDNRQLQAAKTILLREVDPDSRQTLIRQERSFVYTHGLSSWLSCSGFKPYTNECHGFMGTSEGR